MFVIGYKINEIKDCLNALLNALIKMEDHNKLIKIRQKNIIHKRICKIWDNL